MSATSDYGINTTHAFKVAIGDVGTQRSEKHLAIDACMCTSLKVGTAEARDVVQMQKKLSSSKSNIKGI